MICYKAGYKFVDGGVHAQVLDVPGLVTPLEFLGEMP